MQKNTAVPCGAENNTNKPDGGYIRIPCVSLYMAIFLRLKGVIKEIDFRVYLALWEVRERRKFTGKGKTPFYSFQEIAKIVQRGLSECEIRKSIARLQKTALIEFEDAKITFSKDTSIIPYDMQNEFEEKFDLIKNHNRNLIIPRRLLRFMAGGAKPSVVRTLIAHLMRCLYQWKGVCSPEGATKISWIVNVFGISERSARSARKHLVELRILLPIDVLRWYHNKYGWKCAVNLHWKDIPVSEPESDEATEKEVPKIAPPSPENTEKIAPPYINQNLPSKKVLKNQKLRDDAPETPDGFSKKEIQKETKPDLFHITRADMDSTERVLILFDQAVNKGYVAGSEVERLDFIAACEHARGMGSVNPAGLFFWIVKNGKWGYITNLDEDLAHERLKQHFFGVEDQEGRGLSETENVKPPLNHDAKIYEKIMMLCLERDFEGDPFLLVKRCQKDWTRERWNEAKESYHQRA